jgi:hypothetical protein
MGRKRRERVRNTSRSSLGTAAGERSGADVGADRTWAASPPSAFLHCSMPAKKPYPWPPPPLGRQRHLHRASVDALRSRKSWLRLLAGCSITSDTGALTAVARTRKRARLLLYLYYAFEPPRVRSSGGLQLRAGPSPSPRRPSTATPRAPSVASPLAARKGGARRPNFPPLSRPGFHNMRTDAGIDSDPARKRFGPRDRHDEGNR